MAQEVLKLAQEVFWGGQKMGEVKLNRGKNRDFTNRNYGNK